MRTTRMIERSKAGVLVAVTVLALVSGSRLSAQMNVSVTVDTARTESFLAPQAMGIHNSIYDGAMSSPAVPALLKSAGINALRYPGGGYSDNYHWSTHTMNVWKATTDHGYIAKGTDFGSFVKLLDSVGGAAIITVNYGSNAQGTGPGEPAEAAAWVAYANGKADDTHGIGKDSTGVDWKTTGYWATMRSSQPLAADDGYNFLRIGHPQPLNIKYWEVGNELFGNGYYAKDGSGYENDLHVPYNKDPKQDTLTRPKNAKLSPTAYGQGVVVFSKAMKAVDPRISIGAVLNTPPADYSWGPDWDKNVLQACAPEIDFVIIHWYPGNLIPPDWKNLDNPNFLNAPRHELPDMIAELGDLFKQYAGGKNLQLAVTELGPRPGGKVTDTTVIGLFAADAYAGLAEDGAMNIDWLELHQGEFLDSNGDTPHAAYFGIQMMHRLLNMRDYFVASKSSSNFVSVHAAKRADGSIGVMLINKNPNSDATVKVKISGPDLATHGVRFDWGKSKPGNGSMVQQSAADNLGNSFTLTVPAYTVTDVVIPKAN